MKEYIVPVGDKGNMSMIENELHLQQLIRCKDCQWYDEKISFCDNCYLPREQTFFCADGKRRECVKPVTRSATDWDGVECE